MFPNHQNCDDNNKTCKKMISVIGKSPSIKKGR